MSLVKAAEQPNGHHAEPETHAELDAKATNAPDPVVAPRADPPGPSGQPGSSAKEKDEAAGTTARSAVPATSGVGGEIKPGGDPSDETQQQQQQPALSGEGSAVEKVAVGDTDAVTIEQEVLRPKRADAAAEEKTGSTRVRRVPPPPLRHPHPMRPSMEAEAERQAPSDTRTSLDNGGADRPHSYRGKDKFEEDSQPRFAPDGTPYVGDGTWEERTWKELTRLREDMFWARMGRAH
jgi:Rab guanine nucleotide exchange factor SEC2